MAWGDIPTWPGWLYAGAADQVATEVRLRADGWRDPRRLWIRRPQRSDRVIHPVLLRKGEGRAPKGWVRVCDVTQETTWEQVRAHVLIVAERCLDEVTV